MTADIPLGGFRQHDHQKTSDIESYHTAAERVLAPYRRYTLQHPALVWAAQWLYKLTGRGGQRFGSRLAQVHYDTLANAWRFTARYCI